MQLSISGHQLDLTDSLKNYITEKMDKIDRHFDHVNKTHVVLNVDKIRHEAEATIDAKGFSIHATAEADNMYAAIDAMISKLDTQVLKHKGKMTDHHQNEGGIKQNIA